MLTPENIKEKSFHTTGRGSYRADDVDNFLNEVTASYEQMFNQNADLVKKISLLAKKIEEYRADEESLKMALLNAQKLADKIVAEARETAERENAEINEETARLHEVAEKVAKEAEENAKAEAEKIVADAKAEAEAILNDANAQAKDILGNINRKVTHESLVYEMIQKEASEFKSKLVAMYKEHINLINQLPEFVENKLEEEVVEEKVEEVEMVEEVVEEPVVKKPFKLDLSKIDFADDDDFVTEPEAPAIVEEVVEEATEDDDEEPKSISFKNFFKKK